MADGIDLANIEELMVRKAATLERVIGEAALLFMRHPRYSLGHLADLRRLLMSPVLINQYRFVQDRQGRYAGFATWALVSEEVHRRLMDEAPTLRPSEWLCGDIPVIMLVVAPSAAAERKIVDAVAQAEFAGRPAWRTRGHDGASSGLVALDSEMTRKSSADAGSDKDP